MSSLTMKEKENIEKLLDEVLNENISVDDFQQKAALSLEDDNFNKVNKILLEYYNENIGGDFQATLKAQIKSMTNEKVVSEIENKDEKGKGTREESEIEKDIVSDIGGVDKDVLEKAENEVKSKNEKGNTMSKEAVDFRAEIMKYVYIETFKKYENTLYDMKKRQIGKDSLTVGDKEGTELVLYERYLQNLERNYTGYASSRNLEARVLSEDKEISDIKNKLNNDLGRQEEKSRERIDKKITYINSLQEKREGIANKIVKLSEGNMSKENPEEFKRVMDEYQKEYREMTFKIRDISPSMEEYVEQIQLENENIELANKYGINDRSNDLVAGNVIKDKNKHLKEREDDNITPEGNIKDVLNKEDDTQAQAINNLLKEADKLVHNGEYKSAEEMIEQAEEMLGTKEQNVKEIEKQKESNEKLDEKLDEKTYRNYNEKEKIDSKEESIRTGTNIKIIENCDESESWKESVNKLDETQKKDELNCRLKACDGKFRELYPDWNKNYDDNIKKMQRDNENVRQLGN